MKLRPRWLLAGLPALIGIGYDLAVAAFGWNNPLIYMKSQLSVLVLFLGVLTTILLAARLALQAWADQVQALAISQAAEERRRFIRRLDHELKNPLTAIRAGIANLSGAPGSDLSPAGSDRLAANRDQQAALESIDAQAQRLSRLATDLRKLAELERRPLERSQVDLGELLEETYQLALDMPEAQARRITLSIPQAPWPLPKISGDQDLLFLAIHNLLDNAIKYSQAGSTIEIRGFEDDSSVVIEVADTGPGIPEDEAPNVWEELYRGKGARGIPGSGLGLALVRSIAEKHTGAISLRSRVGEGTVFSMRLPI